MQELYRDFVSLERKSNSWRITCLFFFVSASKVTLWPWIPLMLFYAGSTLSQIGLFIFILHIISILSLKLTLSIIHRTKSGSVRKYNLFSLAVFSFLFGLAGLLLVPFPKGETFCGSLEGPNVNDLPRNNSSQILHVNSTKEFHSYGIKNELFDQSNNTLLRNYTDKIKYSEITNNRSLQSSEPFSGHGPSNTNEFININNILNKTQFRHTGQKESYDGKDNEERIFRIGDEHIRNDKKRLPTNAQQVSNNKYTKQSPNLFDTESLYDEYNLYDYDADINSNEYSLRNNLKQEDPVYKISNGYEPGIHNSRLPSIPPQSKKSTLQYNQKIGNKDKYDEVFKSEIYPPLIDANEKTSQSEHSRGKISGELIVKAITEELKPILAEMKPLVIFGIVTTLTFSVLFGGGIEFALTTLWYCYTYGVPQDAGYLDGLECNIVPPSKPLFISDQKVWLSFASCLWLLIITISICFACRIGFVVSPFQILVVFFFTSEFLKCIAMLTIYVPFGNLRVAKSNRTLGLYLDNEVIEEGIRRLTFHGWVLISGIMISFPTFYVILLIQEMHEPQKEIWIAQTCAIAASLLGEAIVLVSERWIMKKFNISCIMIAIGCLVVAQNLLFWNATSIWIKSASPALIGLANSALWISVRINSQTLGTSEDQKRESWISWICFKIGMGIGSIIWTFVADTKWSSYTLKNVLPISTYFSVLTCCIVGITSLVCSRRKKNKRIYHTLDIVEESDDEADSSEINLNEDDWLIKRANKEGFHL